MYCTLWPVALVNDNQIWDLEKALTHATENSSVTLQMFLFLPLLLLECLVVTSGRSEMPL
jgi:hypothetical protein